MNDKNMQSELLRNDEFMPGVTDEFNPKELTGISRRKFLALAGASAAFAATACTNYRDKGEIMPYVKKPEEVTYGKANYYASTCNECSLACGTLIKTREGRPVKITGNPEHPINKGKICAIGEASILNLYDPDRIKFPLNVKGSDLFLFKNDLSKESWANADKEIVDALNKAKNEGKEVAIITGKVNSPTFARLIEDYKVKFPNVKFYSYELFNEINRISALKKSYNCETLPAINWSEAKTILALDADILGNEGSFLEQVRTFSAQRNPDDPKNFCTIYSAEAGLSITGANADYRFRLRPEAQLEFVLSLLHEILYNKKATSFQPASALESEIKKYSLVQFAEVHKLNIKNLNHLVADLIKAKGKSVVYAGSKLDESTHIAVNLLNEALGNSQIVNYQCSLELMPLSSKSEIKTLIGNIKAGKVAMVIHAGTNPAYNFPVEWGYEKALSNVPMVISLSDEKNESTVAGKLTLPINHNLESWGDYLTRGGFISLQQPVIAPIFNTRQKEAILLNWLSDKPENFDEAIYHKYIQSRWEKEVYPKADSPLDFKQFWFSSLQSGIANLEKELTCACTFSYSGTIVKTAIKDYTLVLTKSHFLGDGKFANNGWLQEIPHPITKATWDNYASVSEATAGELGLKMNDRLQITLGNSSVTLPVMIQPGMADKVVAVDLGYGRTVVGDVGKKVGVKMTEFLAKSDFSDYVIPGVSVSKASGQYIIAMTQEHHAIVEPKVKEEHLKRKIIIEGTLNEYEKNPDFVSKEAEAEIISITKEHKYPGVKWAMAIDLNKCTGCSQCVASCNVENNIPVVGKEQVLKGREMHWMRIDRYYAGPNDEPNVSVQPMLCAHCDNAPCENVCPVVATNHSPDGLNQMVYNRCVGTRYCSNNCPTKVRRYNFFNFRANFADGYYEQDSLQLLHNPEVTVRSRGVMEKCTFCIQRISEARQNAIKEGREIKGEDVQTACQVSCPTSAITFGDMNNKESEITKKREHKLNYYVFAELNIKPNVSYMAKLKNKYNEEA